MDYIVIKKRLKSLFYDQIQKQNARMKIKAISVVN